ncbi:MAG: hypothetical protein AMXMBFR84_09080 [Candidatus Hydrogenedentota bacterium]
MISTDQIQFYRDHGYLHIPDVFSQDEVDELTSHLDFLMEQWAITETGWTGPWRKVYMDAETEQKSKLTSLHDLHFYSDAWMRAATGHRMAHIMEQLIGPNVELHHMTLHAKPPETGHPFPMHQDNAFYAHVDGRYVDALIHLDDTCHANGEIRFLRGSHNAGALQHIVTTPEGEACTPHLPTDRYKLEDTTPVPAKRGDVVCFNIFCIHGSHINTTDKVRRMIRVGYRDPENVQIAGQSKGRPGVMVCGKRARQPGQHPFPTEMTVTG